MEIDFSFNQRKRKRNQETRGSEKLKLHLLADIPKPARKAKNGFVVLNYGVPGVE